jgi:hypothetical protein
MFLPIMHLLPESIRNTFIPVTPIILGLYLSWAVMSLPLSTPVQATLIGAIVAIFGFPSKVVFLRSDHLEIEPLIGFLFLGLFRRRILFHDLLRVRFHRQPFAPLFFAEHIDLVTIFGSIRLYRFQGRRFWTLQREFLIRIPEKIGWRPAPPQQVDDIFDL